jgi:hypothetical protein
MCFAGVGHCCSFMINEKKKQKKRLTSDKRDTLPHHPLFFFSFFHVILFLYLLGCVVGPLKLEGPFVEWDLKNCLLKLDMKDLHSPHFYLDSIVEDH